MSSPIAITQPNQTPVEVRYRITGINIHGSGVTLSETFSKLASYLQSETVKDFALTRTNMEHVFTNFAKFQINAATEGTSQQAAAPV